jgi:hypothetical protein
MRPFLIFLFCVLQANLLLGQSKLWKHYRKEFIGGLGVANAFTDLGGAAGDGGYFKDLNIQMTRPAATVGFRYRISPRFAFKSSFSYIWIQGDDRLSKNEGRRKRNITVRTNIYELGTQLEYYIVKEPLGKFNDIKNIRRDYFKHDYSLYVFTGIYSFYFSPLGLSDNGAWYRLAKLNTEGQGLPDGPSKYSQFSVAIPVGIGYKYIVNRQLSFGFEFAVRYTFTDYLDDVSGVYYDNRRIATAYGSLSASFADKRLSGRGRTGTIRGNPNKNDVYFAGFFSINYKLAPHQKIKLLFWRK